MRFRDRVEAGKLLAHKLEKHKGGEVVVYALPRGGVVVGAEVARHLGSPMSLLIPRKVGHPLNPEAAVSAVTEDGHLVSIQQLVSTLDQDWLNEAIKQEQLEARRRRLLYLAGRPEPSVEGKRAIIVDDGIATGLTMLAAIEELKDRQPKNIIVAAPIIPQDIASVLKDQGVVVVALEIPEAYMGSVGSYYDHFEQVEDEEVISTLDSLRAGIKGASRGSGNR